MAERREFAPLELLDQRFQRAAEHGGQIARRHRVAQQGARVLEPLLGFLVDGHAELKTLGSDGLSPAAGRRAGPCGLLHPLRNG